MKAKASETSQLDIDVTSNNVGRAEPRSALAAIKISAPALCGDALEPLSGSRAPCGCLKVFRSSLRSFYRHYLEAIASGPLLPAHVGRLHLTARLLQRSVA